MKVPFIDLIAQLDEVRGPVQEAMRRVVESQRFILGPEVEGFERRLAERAGVGHAVGCASGTDALVLALQALRVGAGHEVAVPAFSFFATAGAVVQAGARPVFLDIEPHTCNLDPGALEAAASPSLRALIVVHLFGRPADMERIRPWCEARGVEIIEDAAQALGAERAGRPIGSFGRAACFSFFPTKNLGAYGDAGAITTGDADLAALLRSLRDHGRGAAGGYEHQRIGLNSRLDAMQAAILSAKLEFLDGWNRRRREHAARYAELFARAGLGEPGSGLVLPPPDPGSTFHQYVVRVERGRDALRRFLEERGIGSAVYYPLPLHEQPALRERGRQPAPLPEAERASREVLALPVYPHLSDDQQRLVVEGVAAWLKA